MSLSCPGCRGWGFRSLTSKILVAGTCFPLQLLFATGDARLVAEKGTFTMVQTGLGSSWKFLYFQPPVYKTLGLTMET